jgi:RNA polymerase sigma factor (sigma-70 family)
MRYERAGNNLQELNVGEETFGGLEIDSCQLRVRLEEDMGTASHEEDLVGIYLRDIRNSLLLQPEEEKLLFRLYEGTVDNRQVLSHLVDDTERGQKWQKYLYCLFSNDQTATFQQVEETILDEEKNRETAEKIIISSNLRLVVAIAKDFKKIWSSKLEFIDLIQAGNKGLISAVEKFDRQRGTRFSTYAYSWIRQKILLEIKDKGRTIRLPVHMVDKISWLRQVADKKLQQTGRAEPADLVDISEVRRRFDLPDDRQEAVKQLEWYFDLMKTPDSLDRLIGAGEGEEQISFIPDGVNVEKQVLDELDKQDKFGKLKNLIWQELTPREEQVLNLRYGFNGNPGLKLADVGLKMNLSREGVRRVEQIALWKLRIASYSNGKEDLTEKEALQPITDILNGGGTDVFFFATFLGISSSLVKKHLPEIARQAGIDYLYSSGNRRYVYAAEDAVKIVRGFYELGCFKRIGHKVRKIK